MKRALTVIIALLALVSGIVVSAQDYTEYEFNGVPSCTAEQNSAMLDMFLDLAALAAVGDTPEDFQDAVKEQAKLQLVEQLEEFETASTAQRRELQDRLADAIIDPDQTGYRLIMSTFWDKPILCREALEMIQRINESEKFRYVVVSVMLYAEAEGFEESAPPAAARMFADDPEARIAELIDYFLENR